MRILLDAKDIIDAIERKGTVKLEDLQDFLIRNNSKLVLTFVNVYETAIPLNHGRVRQVQAGLMGLEDLPHTYLNDAIVALAKLS